MFQRLSPSPWRRIERRDPTGQLRDFVEVGVCARCGRGVDREQPTEYRLVGGELSCAPCAEPKDEKLQGHAPASNI